MLEPRLIKVPAPSMGGRGVGLREPGLYVLATGPGLLQSLNITNPGAGELDLIDGVPDARGWFIADAPLAGSGNGRVLKHFSPTYVGQWPSMVSFSHGLTVVMPGSEVAPPPYVTVSWIADAPEHPEIAPCEEASLLAQDCFCEPVFVEVEPPPMGGKVLCLREKGAFVLEEGPGAVQMVNITHAGAGDFDVIDGVPDERGFFDRADGNGRILAHWSPTYMGAWPMNIGFAHGLTIVSAVADPLEPPPFATVVWRADAGGGTKKKRGRRATSADFVDPLLPHAELRDVRVGCSKGSLMRGLHLNSFGYWRVARRSAELEYVHITHSGMGARLIIRDGRQVPILDQFTTFPGSFYHGAGLMDGITVELNGTQMPPLVELSWREKDSAVV